jgi:hypothetical protein
MPPGTVPRVRAREAAFVAAIAIVTAIALVAGGAVLRMLPDGSDRSLPSDGYPSPLEEVPPGWPAVEISDPREAYLPSVGGDDVTDGPVVLASGTVDGSGFTLYAYSVGRGDDLVECLGFVGFATQGEPVATAPDATTCADVPAVPERQDVAFIGSGSALRPALEANFGFASERVGPVFVWGGGEYGMFRMPTLKGLRGWDVDAFFFVPSADAGPMEVYAKGGPASIQLAHADICHGSSVSGTCRSEVHQDMPVGSPTDVPLPLEPGAWPTVTYGGEFEPYIDHEMDLRGVVDPGVVGEKVAIAYGTVQGAPWSLVAYNMRDADAPDGLNPYCELSVTGAGGGGCALFETTPWQPNDLGASHGWAQPGGFDDLSGVVSSRVATVRLELSDGTVHQADLIPGPPGVDASYFVVFLPARSQGRIVALDAAGNELEQMCLDDMFGVPPGGDPCAAP